MIGLNKHLINGFMKIKLFRDRKTIVWQRDYFEIDAISKEHALKQLLEKQENGNEFDDSFGYKETETLWDSNVEMTVKQNKGHSTQEIFYNLNEDPIWKNGK